MWSGKRVRVTKANAVAAPMFETADELDWNAGEHNLNKTPPKGYWITGLCWQEPQVGNKLMVLRDSRNSINVSGLFVTSIIKEMTLVSNDSLRIETENSVYIMSAEPSAQYSISGEGKELS